MLGVRCSMSADSYVVACGRLSRIKCTCQRGTIEQVKRLANATGLTNRFLLLDLSPTTRWVADSYSEAVFVDTEMKRASSIGQAGFGLSIGLEFTQFGTKSKT